MRNLKTLMLGATVALGSVSTAFAEENQAAGLRAKDAANIFKSCVATAQTTPSPIRGTPGTKMWCAVLDREGQTLLIQATDTGESPGPHLMTDAWRASIEIWRLRPGRKLFEFSADGVQIHVCKRKDQAQKEQGFSWVFEALEAVLFDAQAKQAGIHVEGPASLT